MSLLKITHALVSENVQGYDWIVLSTDLPSPFPAAVKGQVLTLHFETPLGQGVEYVRRHFGLEPTVYGKAGNG